MQFSKSRETNKFQARIVIATGVNVCLAEWITDDTHVLSVCLHMYKIYFISRQVLQKQMDLELELYGDLKDKSSENSMGKVFMLSLSSQPVDHEMPPDGGMGRGKVTNH